ncbi:cell division protein FtsI/penicillin-binding protein 2 [Clostridium sp. CAG:273]|nr:cell division protein FtsI/penicillin-binding protein 2 [Clostridium sp. CAG:273]
MRKDKSQKSKKVVTIPEIKIKKTSVQRIKNLKKNEKDNQEKLRRKLQRRNEKLQKKNKIKNQKTTNKVSEINRKKRMKNMILISFFIFTVILGKIAYLQFAKGQELQSMAYLQQTLDRSVNPKRGTIYDATGKNILAISSTVETVTVNPVNIASKDKEKVAEALANIFELNYEKVLKKVKKHSSIETIVKKVDKDKTDELRSWMEANNITNGINIDEDTKRYYPYNNLASQVIGFTGSDNQGLDGIEAIYENELKGEKGKIVKMTDARGGDIEKEGENYVEPVDGMDLILGIDATIQGIAEKYLKEACIDNKTTDGGNIIIMDPKTGDILAMAGYPNYNLNEPYKPSTDEMKEVWDSLSDSDKTKQMQAMWRNKAVTDTYEPGSTFKLYTASAALEEGIAKPDEKGAFNCTGSIEVAGVRIKCWRHYRPHGSQSLREALMNSCNPVFIGLGEKIGVKTYYEYLRKFGFLKKTGIDLPGEASSIFLKEEKVGPVELATIAFGQRFEITPIQMITGVATIANGGTHVKPRIVKAKVNSKTGERIEIPIEKEENVISKETANNVLSMMNTVVDVGTGKNAQVKGYSIGGKTGTSEDGVNTNKYVTSFVGVAPIEDPQIVLLVTLYNPTGEGGHQGGGVAAPIGGQLFSEILPYIDAKKNEAAESEEIVEVPNIEGITIEEARKILKDSGLDINIEKDESLNEKETIIKEQLPKKGIKLKAGSKVIISY